MFSQLLFSFATGSMLINIVLLVMGLVVVLKGADWLTDGAVNIASRFGVSQMVIGLTIVAMGTTDCRNLSERSRKRGWKACYQFRTTRRYA